MRRVNYLSTLNQVCGINSTPLATLSLLARRWYNHPPVQVKPGRKVLIVGGVAGGASTAARLRRLDNNANIIMYDKGPYVSFANCGLPYFVGGVIKEESALLLATPKLFKDRFRVDVKTLHEVTAIDAKKKEVTVKSVETGKTHTESYDQLVLAPGAGPMIPPLPGVNLPGVFTVRTVPDAKKIKEYIKTNNVKSAVVVGAGFIGLEMAENFHELGLKVTVIERAGQTMPPFDFEMASYVEHEMEKYVSLYVNTTLTKLTQGEGSTKYVETECGKKIEAGVVVLALGVKADTDFAGAAGLELGMRNTIKVDDHMRTSDPNIWACGDAVQVLEYASRVSTNIPLAVPANRQARVVADSLCGKPTGFRGVQATAVCGAFGLTMAMTGETEKSLARQGKLNGVGVIYDHSNDHAGYYPGANPIHSKLIFSLKNGLILGAQAVGHKGVEKRIDVISAFIQCRATIDDMVEAELCYAPQFGSAKDPVQIMGMIASNAQNGDAPCGNWQKVISRAIGEHKHLPPDPNAPALVDVRSPKEFENAHIPGAINIPVDELATRYKELPTDRVINVYCQVGKRGYVATRLLRNLGLNARNLSGGFKTFAMMTGQHIPLLGKCVYDV